MRIHLHLIALGILLIPFSGLGAQPQAGEATGDASLEAEVQASLLGEDLLSGATIEVQVREGIAQLSGFVDLAASKEAALRAASTVGGVHTLDDQIYLKSGNTSISQAVDDQVIATRVRGALAQVHPTTAVGINVTADGGMVLLSGFVADEQMRSDAGEIAESAADVREVINGIYVLE